MLLCSVLLLLVGFVVYACCVVSRLQGCECVWRFEMIVDFVNAFGVVNDIPCCECS